MAKMVVTLRVMPSGTDADLDEIGRKAAKVIEKFQGRVTETEKEEVAFGLTALKISFLVDEKIPTTEPIEKGIAGLKSVSSAEITNMSRAVG